MLVGAVQSLKERNISTFLWLSPLFLLLLEMACSHVHFLLLRPFAECRFDAWRFSACLPSNLRSSAFLVFDNQKSCFKSLSCLDPLPCPRFPALCSLSCLSPRRGRKIPAKPKNDVFVEHYVLALSVTLYSSWQLRRPSFC